MKVLFRGSGDDVVMVGHKYDVVDEEVVFFVCLFEGLEDDPRNFSSFEPECSVVGPADQVVGVDVLNDPKWPSHGEISARTLPKCSDTRKGAGEGGQVSVRIMKVFHLLTRTEPSF